MAFRLSERARLAVQENVLNPNLVLEIDGLNTRFGAGTILRIAKFGGGYVFGDPIIYGGFVAIADQEEIISLESSTNSIRQQIDIDKGRGSSISSMDIALVDVNETATELISPGFVLTDILGRRAKVWLGFQNLAFTEDYIPFFRGIIESVSSESGLITLTIAHPDQKKRVQIFTASEKALDGAINNSTTTIVLNSTSELLTKVLGPDGAYDSSFESYVRIDDEIIKFDGFTGVTLNGVARGQFGTTAVSHNDEAAVTTIYRIKGNIIDLSLKLMLSGLTDYMFKDKPLTNFVEQALPGNPIANSIFFLDIDVKEQYGLVIGDYITTTGASNGANNVTLKQITDVQLTDEGSYIIVGGVSFVSETNSSALISFRSQFDTLPSGMKFLGDEVDVEEHLKIKQRFLSSFEYDFLLDESIENGKDFLEKELYSPGSAYSLPRKARSSIGLHIGPLPNDQVITIDETNVIEPAKIRVKRSINKNFFNTIVYKFDKDLIEDKFLRGRITVSSDSITRFGNDIGTKALVIESLGMREVLSAESIALIASNRRLDRYKYGAEYFDTHVTYGTGFNVEIGDIVIFDGSQLQVSDSQLGKRGMEPRLFEVSNKSLNFKTGEVTVTLTDTSFDGQARYCLIGISSRIKTGISQTEFVVEQFFNSAFGSNEGAKWSRYKNPAVKVRSADFTTRFAQANIQSIAGNQITLNTALGFTPQPGDIMELADYDFAGTTAQIKLLYCFMQDNATFGDGEPQYQMI